jgi:hypothetical protein
VLRVSSDGRRILDEGGAGDHKIHCHYPSPGALDAGEKAFVQRREPRVGIGDHETAELKTRGLRLTLVKSFWA